MYVPYTYLTKGGIEVAVVEDSDVTPGHYTQIRHIPCGEFKRHGSARQIRQTRHERGRGDTGNREEGKGSCGSNVKCQDLTPSYNIRMSLTPSLGLRKET
jgi:hypothetical protein